MARSIPGAYATQCGTVTSFADAVAVTSESALEGKSLENWWGGCIRIS